MEESKFQEDIMAIQKWLKRDCYKIIKRSHQYSIQYINAKKVYASNFFDLEIQYDSIKGSVVLTIISLDEIENEKYSLCLELLNYLNTHYSFLNFFLNPKTVRLSCSTVIATDFNLGSYDLQAYDLEKHTSTIIKKLSRIIHILKDDITLTKAVRKIIGNVSLVRPLLDKNKQSISDFV